MPMHLQLLRPSARGSAIFTTAFVLFTAASVGLAAKPAASPPPLVWLGKPAGFHEIEAVPKGATLAGLSVWTGAAGWSRASDLVPSVLGVAPIYRTGQEAATGKPYGAVEATPVRLEAKPGYALAGIVGRAGDRLDGFRLIFMRVKGAGFDARDQYQSRWVGNRGEAGQEVTLGLDGRPVLGLQFYLNEGRLGGLALVQDAAQLQDTPEPLKTGAMDAIAKAARASGAIVTRDEKLPDKPIIAIDRSSWPTNPGDIALLRGLTTLKRLDLHTASVNIEDAVADLATLTGLEYLDLSGTGARDPALVGVRNLKHLKTLLINAGQITDAGLVNVRGLKSLESISLGFQGISDASMEHLAGLTNLQSLVLNQTLVTDAGLAKIAEFKKLRKLELYTGMIGDDGLAAAEQLEDLEDVTLSGRGFTAGALAHLPPGKLNELFLGGMNHENPTIAALNRFSQLKSLRILQTGITDEALGGLKLPNLESLDLSMGQFSEAGLLKIKSPKKLKVLRLDKNSLGDTSLAFLKNFPKLEELYLVDTGIQDRALSGLRHVPKLKKLDLMQTRVTDQGLAALAALPALESLNVSFTQVRGPGLKHLAKPAKLRSLWCMSSAFDDSGAEILAALSGLEELMLAQTPITDAALKSIGKLVNLKGLALTSTRVTDRGTAPLALLPELESLGLGSPGIGDATIDRIADLPKLKTLHLAASQVSDAGLMRLADAPALFSVQAAATKVSQDGVNRFRSARPNVRVSH